MTRAVNNLCAARLTPSSAAALRGVFWIHPVTLSSSRHPPSMATALERVSGPTDASLESHLRRPPPSLEASASSPSSPALAPWPSESAASAAASTRSSVAARSSAAAA